MTTDPDEELDLAAYAELADNLAAELARTRGVPEAVIRLEKGMPLYHRPPTLRLVRGPADA